MKSIHRVLVCLSVLGFASCKHAAAPASAVKDDFGGNPSRDAHVAVRIQRVIPTNITSAIVSDDSGTVDTLPCRATKGVDGKNLTCEGSRFTFSKVSASGLKTNLLTDTSSGVKSYYDCFASNDLAGPDVRITDDCHFREDLPPTLESTTADPTTFVIQVQRVVVTHAVNAVIYDGSGNLVDTMICKKSSGLDSKRTDCQGQLYSYSMNSLASGLKTNLLVDLDTNAQLRFDCAASNELAGPDIVITAQCAPQ